MYGKAQVLGKEKQQTTEPAGFAVNCMGPLFIGGRGVVPDSKSTDPVVRVTTGCWENFREQLLSLAKRGVKAISTDVWWGVIEPEEGKFDWGYYERIVAIIKDVRAKTGCDLKWMPILSLHQCGGNVGDDVYIPIPAWIWRKYSTDEHIDALVTAGRLAKQDAALFKKGPVFESEKDFLTFLRHNKLLNEVQLKKYEKCKILQFLLNKKFINLQNIRDHNVSLFVASSLKSYLNNWCKWIHWLKLDPEKLWKVYSQEQKQTSFNEAAVIHILHEFGIVDASFDKGYNTHTKYCRTNLLKYVSENGNFCSEYVSAWATAIVLSDYAKVMQKFQEHFANDQYLIEEINISLGPAGELRYPSYNSHDKWKYPHGGHLQAYGPLASKSFRSFLKEKYEHNIENLQKKWNSQDQCFDVIEPVKNPVEFWNERKQIKIQFGKDFFDWYNESLLQHADLIFETARKTFGKEVTIGAKIPGIHWKIGEEIYTDGEIKFKINNRQAELTAGIIRTSDGSCEALTKQLTGYSHIVDVFKRHNIVLHFTCLEKKNKRWAKKALPAGECDKRSLPQALTYWVAKQANASGLIIKGENALDGKIGQLKFWENLNRSVTNGRFYSGVTILRMSSIFAKSALVHLDSFIKKNCTNFKSQGSSKM